MPALVYRIPHNPPRITFVHTSHPHVPCGSLQYASSCHFSSSYSHKWHKSKIHLHESPSENLSVDSGHGLIKSSKITLRQQLIFVILFKEIFTNYKNQEHFPLWLYRLFLELNSLLHIGQEYTKRFGKWIASIWFFTHVVVLLENLRHIPQVGIFSPFLIRNFSKSFGSLISPEEILWLERKTRF